jgi:transposase
VPFVCVQPMVTSWSRRAEDLTCDKTDKKDAVLIARLTAQLRCYVPEPVDETWGRLRHLGTRREQLITGAGSQIQQMRDLLECVWPAALDTVRQPFRPVTRVAALPVIAGRDGGDFARTRRRGAARLRAGNAARDHPPRRAETLPADRARAVHRARRSSRGDRTPRGRAGAGAVPAGRLAAHPGPAGRY